MAEEVLFKRGMTLVRRLILAPGDAMPWHRDPFHRVSVVMQGEAIAIEYRDGSPARRIGVKPGQVDWDEPSAKVHRAVNIGSGTYEEITVFFLDSPDAIPQPSE